MISEFKIENFLSIRSEQTLSFVASKDAFMEKEYSVKMKDGKRILKVALLFGANGTGKSVIVKAFEYFQNLMVTIPQDEKADTGRIPFILDDNSRKEHSKMKMTFYLDKKKYVISVEFDNHIIYKEKLKAYLSAKATTVYDRKYIVYGDKAKTTLSFSEKAELPKSETDFIRNRLTLNCTVMAWLIKFRFNSPVLNNLYHFLLGETSCVVTSSKSMKRMTHDLLLHDEKGEHKEFLEKMLCRGGLNINRIIVNGRNGDIELHFEHNVKGKVFDLQEKFESDGSLRYIGYSGLLYRLFTNSDFAMVDGLETELSHELWNYIMKVFLHNAKNGSQILFTTHDPGLLNEDFIRRDTVWFAYKNEEHETNLKHLTDVKLHKSMSLFNAYKKGKFVDLPVIGDHKLELKGNTQ